MLLQSQPSSKSPSKDLLRSSVSGQPEELCLTRSVSPKPEMPMEGVRLTHQTFVPLPPICSDSTLQSEETTSHQNSTSHLSPEYISEEDTKSTESFFLTQVPSLASPYLQALPPPTGFTDTFRTDSGESSALPTPITTIKAPLNLFWEMH